jgi:UDP-N-acetylmuramyl pentapeptide phosphotransferase/UDP-N-acetylglucosamine-1-phosphate transferase
MKPMKPIVYATSVLENLVLLFVIAAIITVALIFALRPLLIRHALARPNARSSHSKPTPQGGGIAVIVAVIVAIGGAAALAPGLVNDPTYLSILLGSTAVLAIVGCADDVRPLGATSRIIFQAAAAAIVVAALPQQIQIVPALPLWFERICLVVGCVWFVNLVNFMDGIDWMTVAEVVPLTVGLIGFGLAGLLPHDATLVAATLAGAIIGFAPFNRPVAKLFLGDVGSLPIGLMLSWMLCLLAGKSQVAAALLLPLYYLADATITLLRRIFNGAPVTLAHRDHFYQRAIEGGYGVYQVVGTVFVLNVILVALAAASTCSTSAEFQMAALAIGSVLVGIVLWKFDSGKH